MKTAGIICEYNPFHLGHARQMALLREELGPDTAIICVMSGNFVQRGLPAMWDKFVRAKAAIACGADLVLELPLTCVLQSAEGFARGGVEILTRLGCVDRLCFGVEAEHPEALLSLVQRMNSTEADNALREGLDRGLPYAAARQAALGDADGLLSKPNNILGFEYCRAIEALKSPITPLMIRRTGDYHAVTPDPQAPSATSIRALFPDGPWDRYMPREAVPILQDAAWYDISYGERAMLAVLRSLTDAQWESCGHGSEGLWSKVMKAARSQPDLESIITASKSKRYPRTRIQRLLLCAYLGITVSDLQQPIPYVRILAMSQNGRGIVRQARKGGTLPLLNSGQTPEDRSYYRLEAKASDLFTLFAAPSFPCPAGMEQTARLSL